MDEFVQAVFSKCDDCIKRLHAPPTALNLSLGMLASIRWASMAHDSPSVLNVIGVRYDEYEEPEYRLAGIPLHPVMGMADDTIYVMYEGEQEAEITWSWKDHRAASND